MPLAVGQCQQPTAAVRGARTPGTLLAINAVRAAYVSKLESSARRDAFGNRLEAMPTLSGMLRPERIECAGRAHAAIQRSALAPLEARRGETPTVRAVVI